MRSFGIELEFPSSILDPIYRRGDDLSPLCRNLRPDLDIHYYRDFPNHLKRWVLKLEGGGYEITSPKMKGWKKFHKELDSLLDFLRSLEKKALGKGRYIPGVLARRENMGHHVHIDFPEKAGGGFQNSDLLEILHVFSLYEHYLFLLQPHYRMTSKWCHSIGRLRKILPCKVPASLGEIRRLDSNSALKILMQRSWIFGKGSSLSFAPLARYGSIELRLGAISFNTEDVYSWTHLCQRALDRTIGLVANKGEEPEFTSLRSFLDFTEVPDSIRDWAFKARKRYHSWKREEGYSYRKRLS